MRYRTLRPKAQAGVDEALAFTWSCQKQALYVQYSCISSRDTLWANRLMLGDGYLVLFPSLLCYGIIEEANVYD